MCICPRCSPNKPAVNCLWWSRSPPHSWCNIQPSQNYALYLLNIHRCHNREGPVHCIRCDAACHHDPADAADATARNTAVISYAMAWNLALALFGVESRHLFYRSRQLGRLTLAHRYLLGLLDTTPIRWNGCTSSPRR